jgi:hypothetical protein
MAVTMPPSPSYVSPFSDANDGRGIGARSARCALRERAPDAPAFAALHECPSGREQHFQKLFQLVVDQKV